MGNIVLLDDLTINKIAAGEVIERPASVVKELVENSIDAGATNITCEIKNGGISYIRITDNGKGIEPDDMEIAFERHATSKIRSAKDLELVKSMGFRGEALASIASIARVELTSKTENGELGYQIVVEGGNVINKEITGCPKGTTIIVENLFYNTPVRYKFLKKDFTELGYIEDAITRLALVHPEISFKLINSGKNVIQTNGNGNLQDAVYSIYGKEIAENIINIDYQYEDMKVSGCIGNESIAKNTRSNQIFYVNKRYVKDKTLTSAADQSFKNVLAPGKYGFLVLNIEIDSRKIDVNVHPAKLEIRFQEESEVFKLVYHAIKEALDKNNSNENKIGQGEMKGIDNGQIALNYKEEKRVMEEDSEYKLLNYEAENTNRNHSVDREENEFKDPDSENLIEDLYNQKLRESVLKEIDDVDGVKEEIKIDEASKLDSKIDSIFSSFSSIANGLSTDLQMNFKSENSNEEISTIEEAIEAAKKSEENENLNLSEIAESKTSEEISSDNLVEKDESSKSFEEMYKATFGISAHKQEAQEELPKDNKVSNLDINRAEKISTLKNLGIYSKIKYKFIGIIFSSYIVVEIDNDLYIIDQKLANQSIVFDQLKKNYYSENNYDSQQMLLPDIIELTPKQMDVVKDNIAIFEKAGFTVEEFGENTIKLSGAPEICLDIDNKELFIECLNKINTIARNATHEIEEKFLETVAGKVAENTKNAVTYEEVDALMQRLLTKGNPFAEESNKSIAIKLSKQEIDKKFE